MKKIVLLLVTMFLFTQCSKRESRNKPEESIECSETVSVNGTEICLPELKGNVNVVDNDEYSTFVKGIALGENEMLAVYVDAKYVANSEIPEDDYSSLYLNSRMKKDLSNREFKKVSETMGGYLQKADFLDKVNKKIEEHIDSNYLENISYDAPVAIDEYSLNDDVKTFVLLSKSMFGDGETFISLTTLNLIHVKDKLLMYNYTIKYNDASSINELKQKNDYFVLRLLDANKSELLIY